MRNLILILLSTLASNANAEVVKLDCNKFKDTSGDKSPLVFDTDIKTAKFSNWSSAKALLWNENSIVWAQVSRDKSFAGLFFYNRNEDLLSVETISESDFWNGMNSLKEPVNEPYRCRRKSF